MFSALRPTRACALACLVLLGGGAAGAGAAATTASTTVGSTTTTTTTTAAGGSVPPGGTAVTSSPAPSLPDRAAKQQPPGVAGGARGVRARLASRKGAPAPVAVAHAANDPGVGILDFRFAPASITIHVGDTVTWTNNGRAPHSATANDGSFNTGILRAGASASHTFTRAGTFTYFCSVHPFMHGTVVVAGTSAGTPANTTAPSSPTSTSGSSSGSTSAGSAGGTSASSGTTSSSTGGGRATLPLTGGDPGGVVAAGVALLCFGGLLRRTLRRVFTVR